MGAQEDRKVRKEEGRRERVDTRGRQTLDAQTRLAVLLGQPVAHSLSPLMHNAAFHAQGVNAVYLAAPVPPDALEAAVAGLRALGSLGANVTIPHKETVRAYLDAETERAAAVGAVNTLAWEEKAGRRLLRGDNTDVAGFLAPLEEHAEQLHGAEVLIFGAGGAARAACCALLTTYAPARLTLAARSPQKAERMAADFSQHDTRAALRVAPLGDAGAAVRTAALLVNATPLGMYPHTDGTPWVCSADFSEGQLAYDLVYNPRQTRFLREAAARGAAPLGGLEMLIGQAAAAYRQWTGREMPLEAVRVALQTRAAERS